MGPEPCSHRVYGSETGLTRLTCGGVRGGPWPRPRAARPRASRRRWRPRAPARRRRPASPGWCGPASAPSPTLTTPSGSTSSTTSPELADHPLPTDRRRGEPGAHHRRHADDEGRASMPPMPASSVIHDGRSVAPGSGSNSSRLPTIGQHDADPGPESRHPDLDVDGEGEHRQRRSGRPPTAGPAATASPRARQHGAHRTDDAGDADTGGEELEDQQRQADQQQQVGDRPGWRRCGTAGRRGRAWRTARWRSCRAAACRRRAIDSLGGVEHDAVLLVAVEGVDHVDDRRDALVGDPLLEHAEAAGVATARASRCAGRRRRRRSRPSGRSGAAGRRRGRPARPAPCPVTSATASSWAGVP